MKIELEEGIKEEPEEAEDSETLSKKSTFANFAPNVQHKVLFDGECSSLYSYTRTETNFDYDYEINLVKLKERKENDTVFIDMYMDIPDKQNNKTKEITKIDPSETLFDSLKIPYDGDPKLMNPNNSKKREKANCFKRLVSKKKRRLQNEFYDLDMSYITERVIGMGFKFIIYVLKIREYIRKSIGLLKKLDYFLSMIMPLVQ